MTGRSPSPDPERYPAIPGYRIVRMLGRGAQGAVFLGHATDDLAKPAALKYFPPIGQGTYRRELATFRAIEAARRESGCPHLVEGFAARELPSGAAFIAMGYCAHGTLADLVRARGPFPDADALRHLCPVLSALEVLHERGLYHKDVKPSNILLASDGTVRLGDFGLARGLDQSVTQGGSPGFVAPEVIRGDRRADGVRLDVYSAGATLYFLLTGTPPLANTLITFDLQRATASIALQDAVIRALHVDPAERFPTMRAFRLALERAIDIGGCGEDPSDRTAGIHRRSDRAPLDERPTISHPETRTSAGGPNARSRRRRYGRIAVAAAVLLGFTAAGLYRALRDEPTTLASPPGVTIEARGVVFRTADGQEIVDALDEPVTIDPAKTAIRTGGRYVAVARTYSDLRLNRLYLFDRRTHQRAAGWERPMVLTPEKDAPSAWAKRFDLYDASARWRSWSEQVRIEDLDGDGEPELLAVTRHPRGLASTMLLCIDPRTRAVRGAYQQFGTFRLHDVIDVDGDGLRDVLFSWQNNYITMEGAKSSVASMGIAAVSGRALVSGGRVAGPPSLPGREADLAHLLLYAALPMVRSQGTALPLHALHIRWDPIIRRFLATVESGGLAWNEKRRRFEQLPPEATLAVHGRLYYTFGPDGACESYDPVDPGLTMLPALPLVVGGRPTELLLRQVDGRNNGVEIRRLSIPRARMIPKP